MRDYIQKPLALLLSASVLLTYGSPIYAAEHTLINESKTVQDKAYQDNQSDSQRGGLFLVKDNTSGRGDMDVQILNSTFENNKAGAKGYGGVIFQQNGTLTIDSSSFSKNNAEWDGGAISTATPYSTGKKDGAGKLIVKNSTFDQNTVDTYSGGAIGLYTEGELSGNKFTNNNAGGHNPADKTDGGGAIYLGGWAQATLQGNTYEGNSSNRGGAIATSAAGVAEPAYIRSTGETFTSNTATLDGGAVYNHFATENNYITSATFTGNKAEHNGGAVYNDGNLTLQGKFENNEAQEGGAIFNAANGVVTVASGSVFKENHTFTERGGAISSSGQLNIENGVRFEKNTADDFVGGALFVRGETSIDGADFTENTAKWGGAVYQALHGDLLSVKNSTFTGNSADGIGALGLFSKASVENTTFTGNKATADDDGGGALFTGSESVVSVKNSIFDGNVSATRGGAISTRTPRENNNAASLEITDSVFNANTAATDGGAIYTAFYHSATDENAVHIADSVFTVNEANNGGAVYNAEGTDKEGKASALTLENVTFTGNTASEKGGAIYNAGTLTLAGNNTFSGNTAAEQANDIYNTGTLNITNGTTTLEGGISGTGSVNVASGSTLDIGLSTLEGGAVSFANNSTLGVTLASDTMGGIKADSITVGEGESDQAKLLVTLSKDFLTDTTGVTKQLTNGTEVANGSFAMADVNNALYNVSFNQDTNEVTAVRKSQEEQNAAIAQAGGNSNTANVINAFTSASDLGSDAANQTADIINQLAQTDTAAAVKTAKTLAPEEASAKQVVHASAARQLFSAIDTHINTAFASSPRAFALADENQALYNSGKNYSVWAQGLVNKTHKEETSASSFTGRSTGLAGGADMKLGEDWIAGLGYAYLHTNVDSFNRHNRILGDNFFLYGQYRPGRFFVQGALTYGDSKYEEDKYLPGLTVDADYHVKSYAANLSAGYELNEWLTPMLGVRYMNLQQEGYTDSSDQHVSAEQNNYLSGVLGAKMQQEYRLAGVRLLPQINAGLAYDFVSDDNNGTVSLPNGTAYDINGERLHRLAFEAGASVAALVSDNVEVLLGYDGNFRQDYNAHTGSLKLRYMF